MPSKEFLRPRLHGRRFDEGGIPLEFLGNLAVLQKMVLDVAKWRFLQSNPWRRRIPRGFTKDVHLKITELIEGNSVTPVITLSTTRPPSLMSYHGHQAYFDDAIECIINAMNAPEESIHSARNGALPRRYFDYFDRIGRNLQDGEAIDFSVPSGRVSARLDKERINYLLAISGTERDIEGVILRGSVSEVDLDKMTFEIQPIYGSKVTAPIPEQHFDAIVNAFNGYKQNTRVLVRGLARGEERYGSKRRLRTLERVEHVTLLNSLDVPARLDEFRDMRDGWADGIQHPSDWGNGYGKAPSHEGLDWLADKFTSEYPEDLPLPRAYPTPEGGVEMEWRLGRYDISLEVDFEGHVGEWNWVDLNSEEEGENALDMDDGGDWRWVAAELRRFIGGAN